MTNISKFLLDPRVLAVIGLLALAGLLLLGADALRIGMVWGLALLALVLLAWGGVWAYKRWQTHQAAKALEGALDAEADKAMKVAAQQGKADEVAAVRERMAEAVKLIKSSKLGETSGGAALYELPWYAIIGNPAAGKSSAIVKSGLKFPFADNTEQVIQGIGGTRHCDWYFTNEGIVLDTAGRYSVHEEDRSEWLGFLGLLKRYRAKAPLNGVIIAVSVAEICGQRSDFAVDLAIKLRQRVQELTERLEVFVPVYVLFTKADLIAGFVDFFEDRDRAERDKVWGATLPYAPQGKADAVAQFDEQFDVLFQGLKEASVARMSLHRGEQLPPGVLTFPLEFAALKPTLRTFINTLFEDNPYQFRPIFRGFYFTSAVQEGQSTSRASERVADQFGLQLQPGTSAAVYAHGGFFLKELFSKVIFADRQLVQQYTSRNKLRLRYATFAGGALTLGLLLAGWTWSYTGNRAWVANVQADLVRAQQVQAGKVDLASRLEALEILQDRLEQVQRQQSQRPWQLGLGLYQGDVVAQRLQEEYDAGLQAVMLQPAAQAIASYLAEVNAHADSLQPIQRLADGGSEEGAQAQVQSQGQRAAADSSSPYTQASSTDVTQAYNALKAYLMLGDRQRLEPGHMSDQLTRFWRAWLDANRGNLPREQLIRRAEHIMSFAVAQMARPDFPQQELNLSLLDQTRSNLRRVIKGMPARERVYNELKARAATRFPAITVMNLVGDEDRKYIAGSHAVSGVFTRQAWDDYIKQAIKDAAHGELQSSDWVLKTAGSDDLTLEGSPEQIEKALVAMYKADYVREWQRFMQGVDIAPFDSFEQAQLAMNRLGDPRNSPVGTVFRTLYDQTSWDNPSALNAQLGAGKLAFVEWFKQKVLGLAPAPVKLDVKVGGGDAIAMGPIGKEFSALNALMAPRAEGDPLFNRYLLSLAKVRSRFNQMKTQGDPGPGARKWMLETLEGAGEMAEALKLVDEDMMAGVPANTRQSLRPLMVRPLMQAYAVIVQPAEADLNRTWAAQVYEPYQRTLAAKYPFDRSAKLEASPAEVAKVFGSEGAIAKFVEQNLVTLVTKRGDSMTPRTWADMGVRLRPEFVAGLSAWVAPLAGQGPGAGGGAVPAAGGAPAAAAEAQTHFQILPLAVPGLAEFTIEIDGQVLRYRNGVASWTPMVWPGPGQRGARVTGLTLDGKPVSFFVEGGQYALEKLINSAERKRIAPQHFQLRWQQAGLSVGIELRLITNPSAEPVTAAGPASGGSAPSNGPAAVPSALPALVAGADTPLAAADRSPNASTGAQP